MVSLLPPRAVTRRKATSALPAISGLFARHTQECCSSNYKGSSFNSQIARQMYFKVLRDHGGTTWNSCIISIYAFPAHGLMHAASYPFWKSRGYRLLLTRINAPSERRQLSIDILLPCIINRTKTRGHSSHVIEIFGPTFVLCSLHANGLENPRGAWLAECKFRNSWLTYPNPP